MTKLLKNDPIIPKKSLGQHFLMHKGIQQKIINACELKSADVVLEIGPGQGALTQLIAPQVKCLIAIEKDTCLAEKLKHDFHDSNTTIINADILKYSFNHLPPKVKVIGNLPYNISTPIIEKIVANRRQCHSLYITVQKEYADRLAAKPNSKIFGSLSCFIQYYADIKILFKIGRGAFYPNPKVQSSFLKCFFYKPAKYKASNEEALFSLIRHAFGQRRKTIYNSLSRFTRKAELLTILKELKINPKSRAENLGLNDYIEISNRLVRL